MANLQCIKGLDEFLKALDQLPKNIARNVLRGAVNAGATVLRKEAVSQAPEYEGDDERVDKGLIKRAIYQKQIPEKSNEYQQTFYVGVRRGPKSTVKVKGNSVVVDAYYWTWLEFGHFYVPPGIVSGKGSEAKNKAHRAAHKGANALWVEPRSFMRPAFAVAKDQAIKAMVSYFEARIPKEAQKLGLTMK
jgi:HK97 gp10 family phage protein